MNLARWMLVFALLLLTAQVFNSYEIEKRGNLVKEAIAAGQKWKDKYQELLKTPDSQHCPGTLALSGDELRIVIRPDGKIISMENAKEECSPSGVCTITNKDK